MRFSWNKSGRASAPDASGNLSGWRIESLALLASLFFLVFCNQVFWQNLITPDRLARPSGWLFLGATGLALLAIHFVLLALLLNRWTLRWLLPLLFIATSFVVFFMGRYHVYFDPSMLRNVLATDVGEASDLMTWSLIPYVLFFGILPLWLFRRLEIVRLPLRQALLRRVLSIFIALAVTAGAVMLVYQEMASTMRNDKALRYLATPANYLYSLARVGFGKAKSVDRVREPIGTDAVTGQRLAAAKKPVVMVMFLGETARAANWGLSGYARQTTPALAEAGVINFASVTSCGTNTETSVPCIFSPGGRRQYDEDRILGSESLLDVAKRAGFRVVWVDNQSGCKGVCAGVESIRPDPAKCEGGECLDEALVDSLKQTIAETPGNLLIVLHQMGNHGPAYFKRYPDRFKVFEPACNESDLARCDQQSIVNAYDNAIRYTDHVLASALTYLKGLKSHDPAMLYVSDHGESLGENGIYLHGIPYAIAPEVQTRVPMIMWLSAGFAATSGVQSDCLARQASQAISHDHLFHTLLGMLDISTSIREPGMDLVSGCKAS